ncbi:MAG: hypothetical protein ACOH2V_00460 [Candidatus Saccharimonadaceae bacterium]
MKITLFDKNEYQQGCYESPVVPNVGDSIFLEGSNITQFIVLKRLFKVTSPNEVVLVGIVTFQ